MKKIIKHKNIWIGLAALLLSGPLHADRLEVLYADERKTSEWLEIKEGEVAEVFSMQGQGNTEQNHPSNHLEFKLNEGDSATRIYSHHSKTNFNKFTIDGPLYLRLANNGWNRTFTRALINVKTSAPSTPAPSATNTTIVIPENTAGKVKVLMESSTDLVTWTPAEPGDYEPSNQKRFFRLRAIQATGN